MEGTAKKPTATSDTDEHPAGPARTLHCPFCDLSIVEDESVETAWVPSNVRAFASEQFAVWRCRSCKSIHARDEVDLDSYYRSYPFHGQKLDGGTRLVFKNILKRAKAGGLTRSDSIIDYGCGSGILVEYLRERGYVDTVGFDAFSDKFDDAALLERKYDCVIAQDLVEHVDDPRATFELLARLTKPGGTVSVGTANALGIDLNLLKRNAHYLHQPYHRHLFSKQALLRLAKDVGWELVRYFPTAYANTLVPFVNVRSWLRYSQLMDNTLDLLMEPIRFNARMLMPAAVLDGLVGGFFCPEVDVTYIFKVRK